LGTQPTGQLTGQGSLSDRLRVLRSLWPARGKPPLSELELLRQGLVPRPKTFVERTFPPRQFLVRGPSQTAVLHLSPRVQITAASLTAVSVIAFIVTATFAAWNPHAADYFAQQMESWRHTAQLEHARATSDRDRLREFAPELAKSLAERDRAAAAALVADKTLAETRTDVERLEAERKRMAFERDRALAERDAALAANREMLRQLDADTRSTIAQVERIIAATGLETGRAATKPKTTTELRAGPRGGPFVTWQAYDRIHEAAFGTPEGTRIDGVASDADRLAALSGFLASLPLSSPLPNVEVSSGYGFRLDPFSRMAAMHEGVDLRGGYNIAVLATAPGKIIHAGWKSEYGLTVEVDHGFGLVTRYAHLAQVSVKEGDIVVLGQTIGTLGATGRTTGAHLHYEVRLDGRPRNPLNFLKLDRNLAKETNHVR
jgi:murein DD-endopeptidase MepM/ murein hydrolase activator NlpD